MTILHITNGLSEGGVETLLYSFSKYLINKGHNVSILVLNGKAINLKEKFEKVGVHIIVGKYRPYNILNIYLIRKYISKYDIVHVHLFPGQLFVAIANWTLGKRKRIITTEHNTWNHRRKYTVFRSLDRWFYRQYRYIIGISEDTSAALRAWLNDEKIFDRILTVNNGVELCETPKVEIGTFGYTSQDFILTMVARFNEQKSQETLIRALTILPNNVCVIFVGTGETLESNKQLAKKLGVNDRVNFAGYRDDISSILRISHVGILCTNWEGFGLSIVEYMLEGIPVIATNVIGVSQIVGWNSLLYEKGNFYELANKIKKLMNDPSYYAQVSQYCLNRSKYFSIEKMSSEYLTIYSSIVKNDVK